MADITVSKTQVSSGLFTLAADTVQAVVFSEDFSRVEVISDGAEDVWYTLDGSTPTVGGKNCFRLPGVGSTLVGSRDPNVGTNTTVKLISSGTPVLTVQLG